MPAQRRTRNDQTRAAQGAWQVAGGRREQGTISSAKLWGPRHLATQHVQFVTQDQQLEILDIQTTATANEHSHQRPERDVENEKAISPILPKPTGRRARHDYWRPSGDRTMPFVVT
jgi:hypothetical protein